MTTEVERLSDEQRDNVLRRVHKLLAIAQDDRANPAEAAAAASQAEKIMRKYQFEHADVIGRKLKAGDDMTTADVMAGAKDNGTPMKKVPVWAGYISSATADLNDCGLKLVWVETSKGEEITVRFYGYKADVQVAAWTYEYLVATVNRLCRAFRTHPTYLGAGGPNGGRPVMNSYRHGVALAICQSLRNWATEKKAEQQIASQSRELVVIKKSAIAEKYDPVVFTRRNTTVTTRDGDAYALGRTDGRAVDVRRRAVSGVSDHLAIRG